MKIMVLRVGIDTGCGGCLAPIYEDNTFEYIPIPDHPWYVNETAYWYSKMWARNSHHTLDELMPSKYAKFPAHNDPEFDTFTYGDPTRNKRAQLLRMTAGDMILFYAGLRPHTEKKGGKVYLIGYFTIKQIHHVLDSLVWPPPELEHLHGNAHFKRTGPEYGLVIAEGDKEKSKLLTKAVCLSDAAQYILPEMHELLGIKGSLKRAIGRWVPENNQYQTLQFLSTLE